MSAAKQEQARNPEWDQFPHIEALVDPNWQEHPERFPRGKLTKIDLVSTAGGAHESVGPNLLAQLREMGLVLDVGCGLDAKGTKFGITTPVGQIPKIYGSIKSTSNN